MGSSGAPFLGCRDQKMANMSTVTDLVTGSLASRTDFALSVANLMLSYSTFVYYLLTLRRLRVLNSLILLLLI